MKNTGCWGTRGWGFKPKDGKKPPDPPGTKSPRQVRKERNDFDKD